jgi:iron complex outermembrane receptor protein
MRFSYALRLCPDIRQIRKPIPALLLFLCLLVGMGSASGADSSSVDPSELINLSLEQLMNIEVTSVSKKAQKISHSAAAIFVIAREDIRRSGATNIPDLLRMVPGLDVARIDSSRWAVSARGFSGRFANKLLVLMDGRTVYDPGFSGVFWDLQDTLLEDVDRIEVIRGPGATLWGANAVNGVINIITRHAGETQGGLLVAGGGSEERAFSGFRYGGKVLENGYGRGYFKYFNRGSFKTPAGEDARDSWQMYRGGGRFDWKPTTRDALTLQGDVYGADENQMTIAPSLAIPPTVAITDSQEVLGGNVLGRWRHELSDISDITLQVYYDRTERRNSQLDASLDVLDVDIEHHWKPGRRHDVIWGLGYRHYQDRFKGDGEIQFDKQHRNNYRLGFFVQDEIELIEDRLHCLVGTKLEENAFSGFEIQPNVRLLWTPHEEHSLWAAASRAVRTPSRAELDARFIQRVIPGQPPTVVTLFGDEDFESEELMAYEMGYRWQLSSKLSFDIAAFFNDYSELRTFETGRPILAEQAVIVPVSAANNLEGETYGVECVVAWRPTSWWHFQAAYTFLQMELNTLDDSNDTTAELADGESPRHQFSFRSMLNLPRNVQLDGWLRYVDGLPAGGIPSYFTLDARLAWRPIPGLELAVVGQNLLDSSHPEFSAEILETLPTEVPRSVYGKITWQF